MVHRIANKRNGPSLSTLLFITALALILFTVPANAIGAIGYVKGDPANGKLAPYFEATSNRTTIISMQNVATIVDWSF